MTFKLRVSVDDGEKLLDTMREYTKAFNICVEWGFSKRTWIKVENHKATYRHVRESGRLPSSFVQGARDCACESLKAVKCETLPERKPFAAMRYNHRVATVNMLHGTATLATTGGRIKVSFHIPDNYKPYFGWSIKSSTVSYRRESKEFYLHVSIETANPATVSDITILGMDRGIKNIVVCSDNTFFNSKAVKSVRAHYARLRAELQSRGTRSAKRTLKKVSGRERRFVTNVNHCIAKAIVNKDYTVFALEDLGKIRVQKRRGKDLNRKLNNWSFYQLKEFLLYKAEALGKRVILVDGRYTSQKCSCCGHVYKGNRNGSDFLCRNCGFHIHADLNASRNIAQAGISGMGRLPVNQPNVASIRQLQASPFRTG